MEQIKRSAICNFVVLATTLQSLQNRPMYPREALSVVWRHCDESGQDQRPSHKARNDKILTPRFLAGLGRSVKPNSTMSLSTIAHKGAVSIMTIHRGLKQLGLTSHTQDKRYLLTNRIKEVCLTSLDKFYLVSNISTTVLVWSPF